MSFHPGVWRLPGPASFVDDIARLAEVGQHVAAILPRRLTEAPQYADELAVAVLDEMVNADRVYPQAADGPLVEALGYQMVDDEHPVTVPDLLMHEHVAARTFVLVASDLDRQHRVELPDFLRRLEAESRAISHSERATLVVILDRTLAPAYAGGESEVALGYLWFWSRVSRWDVAALIAKHSVPVTSWTVAREVHLETVIEIARWDFELAVELSRSWSGVTADLQALLGSDRACKAPTGATQPLQRPRPPDVDVDLWDTGALECWHGSIGISPAWRHGETDAIERAIWSAQARVLLPWVDMKRIALLTATRELVGEDRLRSAVQYLATDGVGSPANRDAIEIGLLYRVIATLIGKSRTDLLLAARSLKRLRNSLAHLEPISIAELEATIALCESFD